MTRYLCHACGVQYPESDEPPVRCLLCEDERQYVDWEGQRWTTLEELRQEHHNELLMMEPWLTRIGTLPGFGIGQHAFLVQTPQGNVLWDCISLIDGATVEAIGALGGIAAIAISHPHYYSSMVEWSHAFDRAPVYLHAADREWVTRPDSSIVLWEGERNELTEGLTLIHAGGHFAGGQMLHWSAGAGGKGVLLPGDIIQVVHDRRWVSFMYSYPNYIPLPAAAVKRVAGSVEPFEFERIYSPWPGRVVMAEGKQAVRRSAERYVAALGADR